MRFDKIHNLANRLLVVFTMKIGFYTLGCKVNQYETQAMEQSLREKGHEVGSLKDRCDAYIINTCSVTAVADKKNRAVIRRVRRDAPNAILAVCGCYTQHAAEKLEGLGIDVVGGSSQRLEFLQKVLEAVETRASATVLDAALKRRSFEVLPAGGLEGRTPCHAEGPGRLRQLLQLLYHPLYPGPGPFCTPGAGGGAGQGAGRRGLSGDHRHRY